MPKMKTRSGAKKRFKVTGKGKVKFKQAFARHMQMNKPKSMKRKARGTDVMIPGDENLVLRYLMPYKRKKKSRSSKTATGLRKKAANDKAAATKATKGGK